MYEINTDQQQLSPEMIQAILRLQGQDTDRKRLDRQTQMAQAMRQQGAEGTRATSPGGGRVGAPNWAGALANVYAMKKASEMDAGANTDRTKLDVDRQDALRSYFEAMRSQQRRQQRNDPTLQQNTGAYFNPDGIA